MKTKSISIPLILGMCIFTVSVNTNPVLAFSTKSVSTSKYITTRPSIQGITNLPDGGKETHYNIDGYTLTAVTPPNGFNPKNATQDQLIKYGFYNRSSNPKRDINKKISTYRKTPSITLTKANVQHGYKSNEVSAIDNFHNTFSKLLSLKNTEFQSSNWSGLGNDTGGFWGVYGEFFQPTIASNSVNGSAESSWVGIGGDALHFNTNNGLIQEGTSYIQSYGVYNVWLEFLYPSKDSYELDLTGMQVSPGDDMAFDVAWDESNYIAYFTFWNYSKGEDEELYAQLDSNYYDSKTAEWIDEAPKINGSIAPLANYGSINWIDCQSYTGTDGWQDLDNRHVNRYSMYDGATLLSQPTNPYASNAFYDNFYNAQ